MFFFFFLRIFQSGKRVCLIREPRRQQTDLYPRKRRAPKPKISIAFPLYSPQKSNGEKHTLSVLPAARRLFDPSVEVEQNCQARGWANPHCPSENRGKPSSKTPRFWPRVLSQTLQPPRKLPLAQELAVTRDPAGEPFSPESSYPRLKPSAAASAAPSSVLPPVATSQSFVIGF